MKRTAAALLLALAAACAHAPKPAGTPAVPACPRGGPRPTRARRAAARAGAALGSPPRGRGCARRAAGVRRARVSTGGGRLRAAAPRPLPSPPSAT